MSQIILVPASRLTLSPLNVRKTQNEAANLQLRADIIARGVIQNLIGLPVPRKKGHYAITAGGRRLTQVHTAIAAGELPDNFEVPVLPIASADDALEASLAENFQRLAMNPADECTAFQHIMQSERATAADVAKRFGLTERFVQGRLRLAALADIIFTALRDGDITLDVAMAYASTGDVERQAAVFQQLKGSYMGYGSNVSTIRRELVSGGFKGTDPKARLVGRDAYLEAGGRIESDLFSDVESETWVNGELLTRLATEKLEQAAAAISEQHGYGSVRATLEGHVPWTDTRGLDRIDAERPPLTEEQEARQQAIETEIAEIENAGDEDDGLTEEQSDRFDALQAELETIVEREPILTDEQKARAVAYVVLGNDGTPRVHHELYEAPQPAEEGDDDGDSRGSSGSLSDKEKTGISQRLGEELAVQKTELIALHVASDPHFALDLGTFIMVDGAIKHGGSELASHLRAGLPQSRISDFTSETQAAERWNGLESGLDRCWTEADTVGERYDAFCALDQEARAAWFGWAVARTIESPPAGKTGSAFLNHLGRKLDIDVAGWWRPTARNYFDRVAKGMTLDALAEVGGSELRARYANSKKGDLAAAAEKLFRGDTIVEASTKEAALRWVPPSMAFGDAGASNNDEGSSAPSKEGGDYPSIEADDLVFDGDADEEDGPIAEAA
jgi:ParB family chromosome partitioning protein